MKDSMKNKLTVNRVRYLYWDKEYNMKEIADMYNLSLWSIHSFMKKSAILRRSNSETNFLLNKSKPQFVVKDKLDVSGEILKTAGIMLYWAEGTLTGNTVDFVNSNPEMVKIFLSFLREICGIKEERLRVYLYAYSYQDIQKLKKYWNRVTGISLSQFTKPYIREGNSNLSNRKLEYGLVHIRYNDKRLLELIRSWIIEYTLWAGTQVAKGDRLCKRSVPSKDGMEK